MLIFQDGAAGEGTEPREQNKTMVVFVLQDGAAGEGTRELARRDCAAAEAVHLPRVRQTLPLQHRCVSRANFLRHSCEAQKQGSRCGAERQENTTRRKHFTKKKNLEK